MAQQPPETNTDSKVNLGAHSGDDSARQPAQKPFDEIGPKVGDSQALSDWGFAGNPAPGPDAG